MAEVAAVAGRGETMPQKSTYFYPKLLRAPLPPGVTDWLATCRAAAADVRARARTPRRARADRGPRSSASARAGDDTTAIDAAAERAVVARLEALGGDFTLVSEELGERRFGAGGPPWVVLDPIDGSANAKRGLPYFSVSIAVADGPTLGDVALRLREGLRQRRGVDGAARRGALDGRPLGAERPKTSSRSSRSRRR